MSAEDKKDGDLSSPSLDELDSAWDEDEEYDEDATTVQKIPKELVALSRRGTEIEQPAKKVEAPEKHEAITARPPPNAEPSVVIDAPHEQLPQATDRVLTIDADEGDEEEEEIEPELVAAEPEAEEEETDAGMVEAEEKRAAAADEAAGLDAEARKVAAEARAANRKEKSRAKTLAAREKRKAHVESQRMKAKKPKRRSTPPPRSPDGEKRAKTPPPPPQRERTTGRPAPMVATSGPPLVGPSRDVLRMVFLVALVVLLGAFVIGLARR